MDQMLLWLALPIVLLLPWALNRLAPRVRIIAQLSPAFWAYALGIALGNVLPGDIKLVELMQDGSVALAIPLLLFSANLHSWWRLAGQSLVAWLMWIAVVVAAAATAASLFRDWVTMPGEMAAMAGAVYSGGTPNMYAVNRAISGDVDLFNQMNLADLVFSGSYLILLLTAIPRLLRGWLPAFTPSETRVTGDPSAPEGAVSLVQRGLGGLAALGVVALSAGLAWLFAGQSLGQDFQMWVIILLALLGLLASRWPGLRQLPGTYSSGEYLFLVFCVAIGSRVKIAELLVSAPLTIAFMATVGGAAMAAHTLLGKLFSIDRDTVLITQVAGIYGPPFIGPMAKKLQNREIVITGMALGVLNLALGNVIGIWIFSWLS